MEEIVGELRKACECAIYHSAPEIEIPAYSGSFQGQSVAQSHQPCGQAQGPPPQVQADVDQVPTRGDEARRTESAAPAGWRRVQKLVAIIHRRAAGS